MNGEHSLRNTVIDSIFIGLVVEDKHKNEIASSGFDGFYTYFASSGFSFGSSTTHWNQLSNFAKSKNLLFIPSVGPGYIDDRVRPWNKRNTKDRADGFYYEHNFKAALASKPDIISITSFNEWHEGTQIEKAVPKKYDEYKYLDYLPYDSSYYLVLTKKWIEKFDGSY